MRPSGHYRTGAISVPTDAAVAEIADSMDLHGVGCVVVVDEEHHPVGIVTDRDLMRRVVAAGRDPAKTTAREVMTTRPETAGVDDSLERLLERMRERSVRRLPVVEDERLVGLVSLDDLVAQLGSELGDIREAYRSEVLGARRGASGRRRRERLEEVLEEMRSEAAQLGASSLEWIQGEVESLRKRLSRP